MMEKIEVDRYSISLGPIADSLESILKEFPAAKLFILTDDHTHTHCLPLIQWSLLGRDYQIYKISPGESQKVITSAIQIWHAMTEARLDRHSIMINLGGGVIGDMGGFCAATYKRGIQFIQIPTTLLSQVDASIGGKLGIDFEGYKNHIGVFQSPLAVLIDPRFLVTLTDRELRSGYAEVIKHCLIADGSFWTELSEIADLRNVDWSSVIRRSIEVKREIVIADPFEKGRRKLLNFGHTLGHAIESQSLETRHPMLHGEAIASGMIYEARLSQRYCGLSNEDLQNITEYIESVYGTAVRFELSDLIPKLMQDKKNKDGKISFSLLTGIGESKWDILLSPVDLALLT